MTTPATKDAPSGANAERPAFGRFFLPGPTEVHPAVLQAMLKPMIGHRGAAMEALLARIQPRLQKVFCTERPVYISSSSATGLMEGAIRNCVKQRVLSLVNGAFSERFHKIAIACGVEHETLEVPLGEGHTPDMLRDRLGRGRFDAVTVVHSETSTGVLNPIAELAQVAHEAGDVALLVDSVTGIAGTKVDTDVWELDFVLTGSQKALALPPGMAFGVAAKPMLDRAKAKTGRGVYFDFLEFEKFQANNQTPNTPALSLLYALDTQLERIESETIQARWARHEAMARRTWNWVDEMSDRGVALSLPARAGFRSPTVTCVRLPSGRTGPEVTAALKAKGFTIAPGYGSLKNETIRIGHMGDHTVAELDVLLDELTKILLA
jgi:aspartate aminotransferase-like enzyme